MPGLIFVMLSKVVFDVIRESIPKSREIKPAPLCADCFFAHAQYAANARSAISCTYGGGVRLMQLDVLYCTDYRDRSLPTHTRAIGFVREIAPVP
jgi:hypothetical protein